MWRILNIQASAKEHEHDAEFTTAAHFELAEFPHGYSNDDQIEDDVDCSRCPGVGVEVDAFSVVLAVPVFPGDADWETLQRGRCAESDDVHDANNYCDIDPASKALMRKYAEVEEEDSYLRQRHRHQV